MEDISILVGGKAGDGIRIAATMVARLFSRYGYRSFVYDDYPSLIRGGHNFSLVRVSKEKIEANNVGIDLMVALDKQTVEKHTPRLNEGGVILFDSSKKGIEAEEIEEGIGVPFKDIVKEMEGISIMRNSAALGAIAKVVGIEWEVVEEVFRKFLPKKTELNLKIARKAYDTASTSNIRAEDLKQEMLPIISGNEAIGLGAVKAGMDAYYAYPMTPSTGILHFLAANRDRFDILVVHPENEIAVMLMALGSAYSGAKTMVGTAGGGFALMVEGLSLSAQSEIPITLVVCQRAAPSTGVPTYTMQSDLHFVLSAGHGEFPRFVVAPGDPEQAYYYTGVAMNVTWKCQVASIVLSDKNLSEGNYSFDPPKYSVEEKEPVLWDGKGDYQRYKDSENGVSPLAFPGNDSAIIKVTSYEHDQYGITTEESEKVAFMQQKRLKKREAIKKEIENIEAVKTYGEDSDTVLVTWGSTKGACVEAASALGLKVVQPIIMEPFPDLSDHIKDAKRIVTVEVNATGQLARLLGNNGIKVDHRVLKYDARPFFTDELTERLRKEVLQ
ncbi:MAG: 2-oxoacid:acceptor oxidoreductase subunit alpha [Candidatus Hadarchaeota archaeon]